MILGIEASNIRAGGGLTHLVEIISNIEADKIGFEQVIVWASQSTLDKLPERDWLLKKSNQMIDKSFLSSFVWQLLFFKRESKQLGCTLVFAPGSTFLSGFRPFVSMSQNMLPFETIELKRFNVIKTRLKFQALYLSQSFTFKRAKALVFLTNYAEGYISDKINLKNRNTMIIPHGINPLFLQEPKVQKAIYMYSNEAPFRLLYVSIITVYKHQWNVVKAVSELRKKGYPVVLDLVGSQEPEGFELYQNVVKTVDTHNEFVFYHGMANKQVLKDFYQQADAFVFASSCENMPIILIEAMTSGLPIACSDRGPMPEVLKENGFYFDPENVESIIASISRMLDNPDERAVKAKMSYRDVQSYTWTACAQKTFGYLYDVAKDTTKLN